MIGTILVSLFVLLFVRTQGFVSGREISPDTFVMRDFQFYEIPIVHLQITPIRRTASTPKTATYLRQKKLIGNPSSPSSRWDLVNISRGFTGGTPLDGQLLVDHLSLEHQGNAYWRQWSIDHPGQAKVFWPVIQRLANRELYLLMPPLFELAQRQQTAAELSAEIDQLLVIQYRDLILDMRSAKRDELANGLLNEALSDFPESDELKALSQPDATADAQANLPAVASLSELSAK
ncbi:hypothetical protein RMSM_03806 [Rhodopirellula maiorica SM1]|uniref:Uncharacterized protein n=1 Tax=Rhodopirellula maiorica SM1 TaxID=1265738 RepID=M5RIZ7_9BACT|nr:hypothetical protein [Rhodopirellula maiorica]EMI19270.1 hypothetical protein RMSM_03806 [Rhodopirellula maiorica SM1]